MAQRLRGLGFRLLGDLRETDELVRRATEASQDAELSLARSCLDVLSIRASRPRTDWHVPDLVVSSGDEHTPAQLDLLGGATGSALFVALDALSPEERVAFVLRDRFDVSLDRIADVVGLPERAVATLADQGRDLVGTPPTPDASVATQHALLDALFEAARHGDHDATVAMYRPDATAHADAGSHAISAVVHGGEQMARRAVMLGRPTSVSHPALVNGAAGSVITSQGEVKSVLAVTFVGGRVAQIDEVIDPVRVAALGVESFLEL